MYNIPCELAKINNDHAGIENVQQSSLVSGIRFEKSRVWTLQKIKKKCKFKILSIRISELDKNTQLKLSRWRNGCNFYASSS